MPSVGITAQPSPSTEESKKVIIDRNQRILDKLDKYKKKDENDNVFYYFYIRELRDLFWILLEDYSSMK